MSNRIQNNQIAELLTQQPAAKPTVSPAERASQAAAFQEILKDQLKVSGHAQTRFQSRNIELEKEQWDRVLEGVQRAASKGAKESLVMVDDVALVVSVKNRTVITAVDKAMLKENVFTNIDSAIIV